MEACKEGKYEIARMLIEDYNASSDECDYNGIFIIIIILLQHMISYIGIFIIAILFVIYCYNVKG